MPSYTLERLLTTGTNKIVAGVDEVGRGAWAGPVSVCAVVTDFSEPPEGLTDSKMLAPGKREAMVVAARSSGSSASGTARRPSRRSTPWG